MIILLILYLALVQNGIGNVAVLKDVEIPLERVLNFIDVRINEFGFDGFFGLTLAQTQLIEILELPISFETFRNVNHFINKCQTILRKSKPLLPKHPSYIVTFANKLLNSQNWLRILPRNITFGEIPNLGIYEHWSSEIILKNKRAIYNGVETNVCLREILELSSNGTCYISAICKEMMLNISRVDTGYLLTHRLLYMQIKRLQGCTILGDLMTTKEYITLFCSYILKEAKTNENLKFPYHDIFLEQVVLCGMEGYREFLKQNWLNTIITWQNPHGCYESVPRKIEIRTGNVEKRTSQIIDYGCSDHSTGLGAAALTLYYKYLCV